jgi:serine/threonine protein kinase
MGLVLAARHVGLDEPVAIKVLLPTMMAVPGMVERFTREARAAAKIKNDHVVQVTDVDALPSGVPYMVMERLEGSDLAVLCQRLGPLPIADAVRYLLETCSAIGEAHAMGIIHRDLKPANLFLARRRDGTTSIKVLDFGISKVMASLGEHTMTVAGEILGSPNYMSPEQISALRDLDGRTDVWSLGVILYKLLTAALPFPSKNLTQLCSMVLLRSPRRPGDLRPDLPPGLEAVILRCLEKDRARRFRTAGELAAALLPFAGSKPRRSGFMPSLQTAMSLTFPPAIQGVSSRAMSESSAILSSSTLKRSREKGAARIRGFLRAVGLLGLGGAGALSLQDQSPPIPPVTATPEITSVTDTGSAAPSIAPAIATIDPASAPLAASSPSVELAPVAAASSPAPTPRFVAKPGPRAGGAKKPRPKDVGF